MRYSFPCPFQLQTDSSALSLSPSAGAVRSEAFAPHQLWSWCRVRNSHFWPREKKENLSRLCTAKDSRKDGSGATALWLDSRKLSGNLDIGSHSSLTPAEPDADIGMNQGPYRIEFVGLGSFKIERTPRWSRGCSMLAP